MATTLRFGHRSVKVKKLQGDLVKLGYSLTPDGVYGINTLRRVKEFQMDEGLKADGVAGPITQEKIQDTLNPVVTQKPQTDTFAYEQFFDKKDAYTVEHGIPAIYWGNVQTLSERLEKVRRKLGVELVIRSGYRSVTYNKAVGGATRSQHLYGKAADIYVKDYQISCYELARRIYDDPELRVLFGGLGLGSVVNLHVDTRERPDPLKPTVWWYGYKSWKTWERTK